MLVTDRYAVIGNPINHSKSPMIHTLFAVETKQLLKYGRILGESARFSEQVYDFFAAGGKGLNVTVPFKQLAWNLAVVRSSRAEDAKAANVLLMQPDGSLFADNTDGPGLVTDLIKNHNVKLKGRTILLVGAGGAARGVLRSLLEQNLARLWIVNRTADKALDLVKLSQANPNAGGKVRGGGFEIIAGERFDIIINATSSSLSGDMPKLPANCLVSGGIVYDMLYSDRPTPFMRWGSERGAGLSVDGLGMLVEQAAESFLIWRGIRPNTSKVLEILRSKSA